MGIPRFSEAKPFYRAAFQRFDDATTLLNAEHNTGAVYLAGYSVECILKALVLASIASATIRKQIQRQFRGSRGHDFEWLKLQYKTMGGPPISGAIAKDFSLVSGWVVEIRYWTGQWNPKDAVDFIAAAERILKWADRRF